jgi:hypothetical protein
VKMPKSSRWYTRKKPHLQIKILKSIALVGRLSQKEATLQFHCKPSTISEAIKIMETKRKLIAQTDAPELNNFKNLKSGMRLIKFYKLSKKGLLAFIDENPSPHGFWVAMMHYCSLNSEAVDKAEFNKYYDLFIQKFVGNFPLRSCFFLSNFFDSLFKKWSSIFNNHQNYVTGTHNYHKRHQTRHAYKVLECLLQNRRVTVEEITALTQLTDQQVRKVLNDYGIMGSNYCYDNLYESVYEPSRTTVDVTMDFLNHLVVASTNEKKYELSLLGILLMLATISLMRQQQKSSSFVSYYDRVASIYSEKLPLIFGKWKLLKNILHLGFFPSILDHIFLDKSEIFSLSVLSGGNKEMYENIRSATLNTINKFFMVFDDGISALATASQEEFLDTTYYQFIQEKLNEIEMSLKFADLKSFGKYMRSKRKPYLARVSLTFKDRPVWKVNRLLPDGQESFNFEDDLHFIENALADEFSLLFYIGLLRDNDHKASDYPLTTAYLRPSPNIVYPRCSLMRIAKSDDEIHNRLTQWINEVTGYQRLVLDKLNEIHTELKNG